MWKGGVIFLIFLSVATSNPLEDTIESKFRVFNNEITPFADATYRLPNNSLPLRYEVQLQTDIDKGNFDFTGNVKIWVKITAATDVITLQHRQTNVTAVYLRNLDMSFNASLTHATIPVYEFLQISLPTVKSVGEEFVLDINYEGEIRNDGGGFYRAYYDENGVRVWYATTQFEVTDARHAMPCYDEPGIRAPIKLSIVHSPNYEAVGNTPVETTGPYLASYQITRFKETPSIQTYLLAFLISPFKYISNNNTRVEQRIYAKPSSIDNGEGNFAIGVVKDVLDKCEQHFGVDYPLSKMDHAAITQVSLN